MRVAEATEAIQARLSLEFNRSHFIQAWKKLKVRPEKGAEHPERTDERYCVYDRAHNDYVYTSAFVDKVVRSVDTVSKFEAFFGRPAKVAAGHEQRSLNAAS